MNKTLVSFICSLIIVISAQELYAQQKLFNKIQDLNTNGVLLSITQDRQGYIWYAYVNASGGLYRYSPSGSIAYFHKTNDPNSLSNNAVRSLCTDSSDMIWIGTWGGGLDRLDPATHTFTHYRHNPKEPGSLSSDSIYALLTDHAGNLWVGTNSGGLNLLNRATGKFTHYTYKPNDTSSLSSNVIIQLYEDREGTLWVSCVPDPKNHETGGLVSMNRITGKFTRFQHDSTNSKSLSNNIVISMMEDSKGNFWVGTNKNGLQTLNRATGEFTHYTYDPSHPERLSPPPVLKEAGANFITFIEEDAKGAIWIGTSAQGINKYDPETKEVTHYGAFSLGDRVLQDTVSGLNNSNTLTSFISKDGLLWISVQGGGESLYTVNPFQKKIPFYPTKQPYINAFYQDKQKALWIATDGGLLYKPMQGEEKLYTHDPHDANSLSLEGISTMIADKNGNLWLGAYDPVSNSVIKSRLDKFDPSTGIFIHYTDSVNQKSTRIKNFCFDDNEQKLWMGTNDGLYEINTKTGALVQHYTHDDKDTNSLSNNQINYVVSNGNRLWIATLGLNQLNKKTGQWKHYLKNSVTLALFKDAAGTLWVGAAGGLYRYDQKKDNFQLYRDAFTGLGPESVQNILEDSRHNLWISGINTIYRISANRDSLRIYGSQYNLDLNVTASQIAYQTADGKIYIGNPTGYYAFYADSLSSIPIIPPTLHITGFLLGDSVVRPGRNSSLKVPVFEAKEINLSHNQNSFSFAFEALHYATPGAVKYRYILEGYDHDWHDVGEQRRAYYFNIQPGHYTFKVMAINSDGSWSTKSIAVNIAPPWWTTWWAISIFILILIGIIWSVVYYRSRQLHKKNKLLEEKVNHRTEQLRKSLEDLRATQKQLIQSEKMASLGELTAGIAHEIQNPLNFVNNFSDVNKELLEELKAERLKQNAERDKQTEDELINDVIANEQKINHHGKRADAIVKGMLQHSRVSTGQKEPTDINALADEYLRLSYHGLRAKDKSFNAEMKTDFDESIGRINIIPQDIGRVLLNLFNNAFYAVSERQKAEGGKLNADSHYEPTVSVATKKIDGNIFIHVKDNGNGIPQKIVDKIFQPFFTTKPTGEGTGLGLSLAYDIVKAHGGELSVGLLSEKVETKEGKGSEFIIQLPI
jgi:ligand-binding sensor domain-containing protein/signal transduction histidine kinase